MLKSPAPAWFFFVRAVVEIPIQAMRATNRARRADGKPFALSPPTETPVLMTVNALKAADRLRQPEPE
jgi:hypothetical protein